MNHLLVRSNIVIDRRYRAIETAHSATSRIVTPTFAGLESRSCEAFNLTGQLQKWYGNQYQRRPAEPDNNTPYCAQFTSQPSPSIYLILLTTLIRWNTSGIPTPALNNLEVECHLENIISTTDQALGNRSVAGASFPPLLCVSQVLGVDSIRFPFQDEKLNSY